MNPRDESRELDRPLLRDADAGIWPRHRKRRSTAKCETSFVGKADRPWTRRWVARDTEVMVKSVEGIYRNGWVELVEPLTEAEGSRVIVTWVHPPEAVNLRERGIDEGQAADLRRHLATFAEDWDRPEMAIYDELPPW